MPNALSRSQITLAKRIVVLVVTFGSTIFFVQLVSPPTTSKPPPPSHRQTNSMARSFILWLHGLGDSGPANEPIKTLFTSPEFRNTVWSFPTRYLQLWCCDAFMV